jgi:hypothetical protein
MTGVGRAPDGAKSRRLTRIDTGDGLLKDQTRIDCAQQAERSASLDQGSPFV